MGQGDAQVSQTLGCPAGVPGADKSREQLLTPPNTLGKVTVISISQTRKPHPQESMPKPPGYQLGFGFYKISITIVPPSEGYESQKVLSKC